MKDVMKLSQIFGLCPASWQNFIQHLQTDPDSDVSLSVINQVLAQDYQAHYTEHDWGGAYVRFSHQKYRVLFELTWS